MPNDNVDIVVTAEYAEQSDSGITGSNFLGPNADDLFVVQSGLEDPFNEIDQLALTANIVWSTGDTTWTSITGWRDLDHNFRIDFSDNPVPAFVIDQTGKHKQFSQEFHWSGSTDTLDWVVGAFYMKETNDNVRRDELFLFGGAVAANLVADFENDADSWAVFGQGAWHINDKWTLLFGGRWSDEQKTMDIVQSVDVGGGVLFPLWGNAELEALGTSTRPEWDQFTPLLGIQYAINDDNMVYAKYTEGFKSGGWNARATDPRDFNLIDAETAEAWEAGFKSEFMNNRLRLNGAFFHNTYKDFIITALNPDTGGFVTINAAEAVIDRKSVV
jgi:iron complex outermembrane receptor protein